MSDSVSSCLSDFLALHGQRCATYYQWNSAFQKLQQQRNEVIETFNQWELEEEERKANGLKVLSPLDRVGLFKSIGELLSSHEHEYNTLVRSRVMKDFQEISLKVKAIIAQLEQRELTTAKQWAQTIKNIQLKEQKNLQTTVAAQLHDNNYFLTTHQSLLKQTQSNDHSTCGSQHQHQHHQHQHQHHGHGHGHGHEHHSHHPPKQPTINEEEEQEEQNHQKNQLGSSSSTHDSSSSSSASSSSSSSSAESVSCFSKPQFDSYLFSLLLLLFL